MCSQSDRRDKLFTILMQISTSAFLNAQLTLHVDKKVVQESASKTFASKEEATLLTPNTNQSVKEVVAKLLSSLVDEAKSKTAVLDLLKNGAVFKNLGSFSSDLKTLVDVLKSDKNFEKPLLFLQNFQKNIDVVDGEILKKQVQNSGLFLESKLANKFLDEPIHPTLKTLIAEVKEHLSATNKSSLLAKEVATVLNALQSPKEISQSELQANLKSVLGLLRQSVKEHLSFESTAPLKEAYGVATKLESVAKQIALITSKIENISNSPEVENSFVAQVKEILSTLKQESQKMQVAFQNDKTVSLVMGEIITQLDSLLAKESFLRPIAVHESENSIEDQLKMVASRIKQQIALVDPQSAKQAQYQENSALLDQKLQSFIKPEIFLNHAITQKLSINPADMEILGDMKGVLTHVSETLSSSNTPNAKEALEVANKLLTQIDYHQLASYVSSATHLYIPFAWDGLNGGSMMMKQTKEDHFHCQIDLDLEKYGKINMMLLLSQEKYIDITIATQKNELKEKVSEHLQSLKQALNEVGLIIGNVKLIDYKEDKMAKNDYFSDEQLNFGINISI
ncbi:MAG: flagellar hook-length control protein FliK [Campylobacteraceae bacterium]|nr:flagellar hook-length control protein FliK [Campylobacteraceae bacterium]